MLDVDRCIRERASQTSTLGLGRPKFRACFCRQDEHAQLAIPIYSKVSTRYGDRKVRVCVFTILELVCHC
jgi:hypothetical protein